MEIMNVSSLVKKTNQTQDVMDLTKCFILQKPGWKTQCAIVAVGLQEFLEFINWQLLTVDEGDFIEYYQHYKDRTPTGMLELHTSYIRELINLVHEPDDSVTMSEDVLNSLAKQYLHSISWDYTGRG